MSGKLHDDGVLEVPNLNFREPLRYERAYSEEGYGSSGVDGLMLFLLGYPKGDEARSIVSRHCRALKEELFTLKRTLDPKHQAAREEWLKDARSIFAEAGLPLIFVKETPNEYDPKYFPLLPWLLVTTPIGTFKIGPRKRVLHIEWADTMVAKSAEELFPDEAVTKGERFIHAWSDSKAAEYVKRVVAAAETEAKR